ncbi:MAG: iron-sulfur cluster repair di-iron protein [Planctomycetia bacterium]|nr:iron-sulfur cluster repair di-iron protein [Planctomycetia bacterium]MCC7314236.1 iron-sulfur cluster repair di-iron protein [Planctomycetota bacterium]
MNDLNPNTTVGALVAEQPARARVFESFGIDYCCGGKRPLAQVCDQGGINFDRVRDALLESDRASRTTEETDWSKASLTDLTQHIVNRHHEFLREELPRLAAMLDKVVVAHGQRHPEMPICRDIFWSFRAEMEAHMHKEESILFPLIRTLETEKHVTPFHCGSIANPISVMEAEHDHAGDALAKLRELTNGFRPPPDACTTFRVLLNDLQRLEADMHQHVHKENNILFPRALELEKNLGTVASA